MNKQGRIRELERKIATVCKRCPHSKWLIGRFQCTVGRRHCHSSRVRRWLGKIKRLEAGDNDRRKPIPGIPAG